MTAKLFDEALEHAIGGGWGSDESREGSKAVRVIRGADFPAARISRLGEAPLRYEKTNKVETRQLELNDIVLEISGGTKGRPTGRTIRVTQGLLGESAFPLIPASFCRLVRIDPRVVDPVFGYYALQDLYNNGGTWKFQNQSTGIANFQFEQFKANYSFPDIAYSEQRAIAEVLGALDDKIAANDAIARTTRDLLAASFAGLGIDRQPETSGASIAISELIEFNPPVPKPTSDVAAYLEMKNLPDEAITSSEWTYREPKGGARFQNGDTLLARITPCLENGKIGFVDFLEESEVGFGSTEFIVMRSRRGTPAALPYFLGISGRFRSFAMRHMVGTSGRQRVSAEDLSVFPVTLPNNDELARFQELSSPLIARVGAAIRESKALASTRDELLPLLMSGKIRVKDAEKVVEEAT